MCRLGHMREERTTVSGSLHRAAVDALPMGFAAVDAAGSVIAWNVEAARMLGWTAEEVLGKRDPSVIESAEHYDAGLARVTSGGVSREFVTRRHRDGHEVTFEVHGVLTFEDDDGRPVVGAFFSEPASDEVRAGRRNELSRALVDAVTEEDVIKALATALPRLVGASGGVVLRPCEPGRHLHGSRMLGGVQEDAESLELDFGGDEPWSFAALGEPQFGSLSLPAAGDVPAMFVAMGPPTERDVLALLYPDGTPTDPSIVSTARAIADEAWIALQRAALIGELEGKIEILEATARVASSAGLELEESLTRICEHAAAALSCERAAIYLRDEDDELRLVHLHATDVDLDADPDGRDLAIEVMSEGTEIIVQDVSSCDFASGPWHHEAGAVSVFGIPLRVADREIGVLAVAHTQANPRGFTNLCQQVGAAAAQQAALAIDNARLYRREQSTVSSLRELQQLREDYIAGITHDLRTPLTGLVGFTRTLRRFGDSVAPEQRAQYLEVMERQANRLVAMVEDLLLAARMESGDVEPAERAPVDLAEVIAEVLALYDEATLPRVEVVDAPPGLCAVGDRAQLSRIVQNLIDNALKYSDEGTNVALSLTRAGPSLELRVADRGEGIAPENLDRVFERFARGSSGERRGSTGLGLFISRGIARGHGGDVSVESVLGEGSTFVVRLPAC